MFGWNGSSAGTSTAAKNMDYWNNAVVEETRQSYV